MKRGLYLLTASRPWRLALSFSLLLAAATAYAGQTVLDDFNAGPGSWSVFERFGQIGPVAVAADSGTTGSGGLRLDYAFGPSGQNYTVGTISGLGFLGYNGSYHVAYSRPVELDLSYYKTLSLDIRTTGVTSGMLILAVWDSQGRIAGWGYYGANFDFITNFPAWTRYTIDLRNAIYGNQNKADLTDIRRIGLIVHAFAYMGDVSGSIWLDNLSLENDFGTVSVAPATFSPNGDAYYDLLEITLHPPPDAVTTVDVLTPPPASAVVATPCRHVTAEGGSMLRTWDGRDGAGRVLPNGDYLVRATYQSPGAGTLTATAPFTLDAGNPRQRIVYQNEPFFPIGVWFEADPTNASFPNTIAGAKAYFDRCCADMSAHGINTLAAANISDALAPTLLNSAAAHGIKVILGGPFNSLMYRSGTLTQAQADSLASQYANRYRNHPAFLRYGISDEPGHTAIPNWLTSQRALWKADPKHPAFTCFLDWGVLDLLLHQTAVSEAVFDIYPLMVGAAPQTLGSFVDYLMAFRWVARDSAPWPVLQAFAKPNVWRYPTSEELRAMTWLSLAAGAKGMFFFIYQTLPNHPERLEGLVDAAGAPTAMYPEATALARTMGKLAPLLLELKPTSFPERGDNGIIGRYRTAAGRPVVIVGSARPDAALTATVANVTPGAWRDALTSQTIQAVDRTLSVALEPGGGRVLLGPEPGCAGPEAMEYK